jgi:hypothetical protein
MTGEGGSSCRGGDPLNWSSLAPGATPRATKELLGDTGTREESVQSGDRGLPAAGVS